MIFSSVVFLMVFLVIVTGLYYLPFNKKHIYKNAVLFFASIFFYAWGEKEAVLILLGSIFFNWIFGLVIDSTKPGLLKRLWRDGAVVFNVGILFIFKYLAFTLKNISYITGSSLDYQIALPIGISFYTFQIISYILDLYNEKVEVQKNPLHLGLYVALFPQLIAGPIVRYKTIEEEIENRVENFDDFKYGLFRFIRGMAKKVLIANSVASLADITFAAESLSVADAWLGAVAYTIQIFFDFSGYSDMAIGLGQMFGFHFEENFNYPYMSKSITEFWRRWHMSLSGWFRDYVYIPLGGSRVGKLKTFRNLFVVWLLTGIWHGANWTFIAWGLMYFALLVIEKTIKPNKIPAAFGHIYTMLFVIIGWVIFRSESLKAAGIYIARMFGIGANGMFSEDTADYFGTYKGFLLLGLLASFPLKKYISEKLKVSEDVSRIIGALYVAVLFVLNVAFVISNDYDPFIYFNF